MKILGIGGLDHNASVALLEDNNLPVFLEFERLSRKKNSGFASEEDLESLLSALFIKDIDHIAIADHCWFNIKKEWLVPFLKKRFPKTLYSVHYHHECHLASAFFFSPFDKALLISVDGKGDNLSTTAGVGSRTQGIKKILEVNSGSSIGRLWWAVSEFCGFSGFHSAGKTMALSAFGSPKYLNFFYKFLHLEPNGAFRFEPEKENPKQFKNLSKLVEWMETISKTSSATKNEIEQPHKDMASSVQKLTVEIVSFLVKKMVSSTQLKNVCFSGGVALNGLCNQFLIDNKIVDDIFIPPFTDDRGLSVGAACLSAINSKIVFQSVPNFSPFLGPENKFQNYNDSIFKYEISMNEVFSTLVQLLIEGAIIAWFIGRDEAGPRALGHRSILATPTKKYIKGYINKNIKQRENFRPFGCSVLQGKVHEWFELKKLSSPFMLQIVKAKASKTEYIPAIMHVDGTSRLHTVTQFSLPELYKLLTLLEEQNHPPLLLNTSLNRKGEPIAHDPKEAFDIAKETNLDAIFLNGKLFLNSSKYPKYGG